MVVATKATRERTWSARGYVSNIRQHRDLCGDGAAGFYGEDAREAALFLLDRGVDRLDAATGRLVRAEKAHGLEKLDDRAPRVRRDRLDEQLRSTLLSLKAGVTGYWGAAEAESRGLVALPQGNEALLMMAESVYQAFMQRPLPEPRSGVRVDNGPLLEQLRQEAVAYASTLADVDREVAEADTTLREKQAATADFDLAFEAAAKVGAVFLELAGASTLADKLRPSPRRTGRTHAVAEGLEEVPEDLDAPPPAPEPVVPVDGEDAA